MAKLSAAGPAGVSVQDPAIEEAARRLRDGELVAFPTETVYGLGARADDDQAVAKIFQAKGRPSDHPLIVHVAGAAAVRAFALPLPPGGWAERLMAAAWPGPVSIVVARRPDVATACAAGAPTIALRCPDHPVARALLERAQALGVPGVAAPSANRFGRVSPTTAAHVRAEFGAAVPVLDGGATREGIESAIVDCTAERPVLLRPGSVPRSQLQQWLGGDAWGQVDAASPRVSGSLQSHYAPERAVVALLPGPAPWDAVRRLRAAGPHGRDGAAASARGGSTVIYAREAPDTDAASAVATVRLDEDFRLPAWAWLPMPDNAAATAHELFAVLRVLEARGATRILVQSPPDDPAWDGVRDRLSRAAAPRPEGLSFDLPCS